MNEARHANLRKILAFAALVEGATGVALLIAPAVVIALLLDVGDPGLGTTIARFLGIALLALGLACWPGGRPAGHDSKTFQAMLVYNLLVALFLAYVGTVGRLGGLLLWPCVMLHATVALLLVWTWRSERMAKTSGP
jgi:hypothetical protein